MTSYNTGVTADSGGADPASQQLVIPAGVAAGNTMLLLTEAFTISGSEATLSVASTGTAFTQIGITQFATTGSVSIQGAIWQATAGASDAGKTITAASTIGAFWALALGCYAGFNQSASIDVAGGIAQTGVATLATPSETTGVNEDWAVYLGAGAVNDGATLTGPAGSTQRLNDVSVSGISAAIFDSNGPVGPAGTLIGGGNFHGSAGNAFMAVFTVGLAPAVSPLVVSAAMLVPDRAGGWKKLLLLG